MEGDQTRGKIGIDLPREEVNTRRGRGSVCFCVAAQVFQNACLYNEPGNTVHDAAVELETFFRQEWLVRRLDQPDPLGCGTRTLTRSLARSLVQRTRKSEP